MQHSKFTQLPLVDEEDAGEEVALLYTEIKRDLQIPEVPNLMKALAVAPNALTMHWGIVRSFYQNITLPEALTSMIMYTIAETSDCQYCSAAHELTCRTLGIDEKTLGALIKDLEHVSPQRLRAIIEFAVKVSRDPQGLQADDYESLRREGVTDEELVEILYIAALTRYVDILADALKVDVDTIIAQALGR